MAGRKSIKLEEMIQHIREKLLEDMDFDPKQVRRFFVSNIFTRTFAHLVAWTGTRAKRLLCTGAGILKVAPLGTGFEHNETHTGTGADDPGDEWQFTETCSRVDVFVFDNPAMVRRKIEGGIWEDWFEVPASGFYSFDCTTDWINIKNKTAAANARYSINGWW